MKRQGCGRGERKERFVRGEIKSHTISLDPRGGGDLAIRKLDKNAWSRPWQSNPADSAAWNIYRDFNQ